MYIKQFRCLDKCACPACGIEINPIALTTAEEKIGIINPPTPVFNLRDLAVGNLILKCPVCDGILDNILGNCSGSFRLQTVLVKVAENAP